MKLLMLFIFRCDYYCSEGFNSISESVSEMPLQMPCYRETIMKCSYILSLKFNSFSQFLNVVNNMNIVAVKSC
jgi:hypothetical protein